MASPLRPWLARKLTRSRVRLQTCASSVSPRSVALSRRAFTLRAPLRQPVRQCCTGCRELRASDQGDLPSASCARVGGRCREARAVRSALLQPGRADRRAGRPISRLRCLYGGGSAGKGTYELAAFVFPTCFSAIRSRLCRSLLLILQRRHEPRL